MIGGGASSGPWSNPALVDLAAAWGGDTQAVAFMSDYTGSKGARSVRQPGAPCAMSEGDFSFTDSYLAGSV